jgi:hypothetical protein
MSPSPIDDSDKLSRSEVMKGALRAVLKETNGEIKALLKEALKEWLDEKYAAAGRWTVNGLLVALVGAACWMILWKAGWTPPK